MSEQYKAGIDATVKMAVTIREYPNGDTEIEEIDEVLEVEGYWNVREKG